MSKIVEMLQPIETFSSEVNLAEELFKMEHNKRRMNSYMPIKAHREAFENLIHGLYEPNDKRCYLLQGSYGTGKSNLLMLLANYLTFDSSSEEMINFFQNYETLAIEEKGDLVSEEDKNKIISNINRIKEYRASSKPYLIALCKYESTGEFTEILLKALKEAFEREGLDFANLDSIYHEAIRKIKIWEENKNSNDFYYKLVDKLKNYGKSVEDFIKNLDNLEIDSLKLFKTYHQEFTLSDFTYDKESIIDILRELSASEFIRDKYSGVSILFDEFGDVLKDKRIKSIQAQRLGEFCAKSLLDNFPVIFITTLHKRITDYSETYEIGDFKKISDRFTEVSLSTSGFEDIIAGLIKPKKDSDLWKDHIEANRKVFFDLANNSSKLKILPDIKGKKLEDKIIKGLFPMHPLATHSLLELSREMASNTRSVFNFFASNRDINKGYINFVNNSDFVDNNNNLNFYTLDNLVDYFENNKFSSNNNELRNEIKQKLRNYETSYGEFLKVGRQIELNDDFYEKIFRVMLIFSIINISSNAKNISFALYNQSTEAEIDAKLKFLNEQGIIFFNTTMNSYEFKPSDMMDVYAVIEEYKNKNNKDISIVTELNKIIDNPYYKLKSILDSSLVPIFNENNCDYGFIKQYIELKDLSSEEFLKSIENSLKNQTITNSEYDAINLVVLCNDENEVNRAKAIAIQTSLENIFISIPSVVSPIKSDLMSIIAIENSDKFRGNLTVAEIQTLEGIKANFRKKLSDALREQIEKETNLQFFYQSNSWTSTSIYKTKELATKVIKEKYKENTPKLPLAINKKYTATAQELRVIQELIEEFLSDKQYIIYDTSNNTSYHDKYTKHLKESCLLIEDQLYGENNLSINRNSEISVYPVIKKAITLISENKELNLKDFSTIAFTEYGCSLNTLIFTIAYLFKYFSGEIYYLDNFNIDKQLKNYANIETAIRNGGLLKLIEISDSSKKFVDSLYRAFKEDIQASDIRTIKSTFQIISEWYKGLSSYQLISDYFDNSVYNLFDKLRKTSNYSSTKFILEDVNTIINKEKDDYITDDEYSIILDKIIDFKENTKQIKYLIVSELEKGLSKKLHIENENINDYLMNFYNSLEEFKKDKSNNKQIGDSRKLLEAFEQASIDGNLIELLIKDYQSWSGNKVPQILDYVTNGYSHLFNMYLVEKPELEFEGIYRRSYNNEIFYGENFKIKVMNFDLNKFTTYYTLDGENILDKFGTKEIHTLNDAYIEGISKICTLQILNRTEDKKMSEIVKYKLKPQEEQFKPKVVEEPAKDQLKINESAKKAEPSLSIPLVPKKKEELKAALQGIIEHIKTENKETLKDSDIASILEDLLKLYR